MRRMALLSEECDVHCSQVCVSLVFWDLRQQQAHLEEDQTDFLSAMVRYNRSNPADPFGPKELRDQVRER
jgi:hypothetical protein